MKATHFFTALFFILFCSCTQQNTFNKIFNKDVLSGQFFTVNKNRDTTLVTKAGMIIQLKKESFESDSTNIKLEIKEALSNEDIVLAGLTTTSGKQALSSGGMLYINAAKGYNVTIKKEIVILVPTKNYNADMSVYEGKEENGKIDWTNPQPLPNDTLQKNIKLGEQIFKANCSNCHMIDDDYTGPALAGVNTRHSKKWIYDWIKNPAGMIAKNKEGRALFEQYKPTVMTAFPAFTHRDIDAILTYVGTRSKRKFAPTIIPEYNGACEDSCMKYLEAVENLRIEKFNLEEEENDEEFFTLDRTIPVPAQIINTQPERSTPAIEKDIIKAQATKKEIITAPTKEKEVVKSDNITATFYTINIKTFGWLNIDILLKNINGFTPSELFVRLQSKYETNYSVILIIPSSKVFVEGGKLQEKNMYGFDETNGKIPLPQNAVCYIIAFTEVDGKLFFGKANFNAGLKQTIDITFTETTKEGLVNEIKALKLDGVEADVKTSTHGNKKIALEKTGTEIEKLKPTNCDCPLPEKNIVDTISKK